MRSRKGRPTGILYGVPQIIRPLLVKFKPVRVFITFDVGLCKTRMELLANYKGDRDDKKKVKYGFDRDDFEAQKRDLIKNIKHLGITVLYEDDQEADDIIYTVTKRYRKRKNRRVVIASTDKDFHQLITKKVWVYNFNLKAVLKPHSLNHYFGYEPEQLVDLLTLMGDKSDAIPGLRGCGEKTAKALLKEYSSIDNFLNSEDSYKRVDKDELEKILVGHRLLINLELYHNKFIKTTKLPIKGKGVYHEDKLHKIANKFNINTFHDAKFKKAFREIGR